MEALDEQKDQIARKEHSRLVQVAFACRDAKPHFIRLSQPEIKEASDKGWSKSPLTLEEVTAHLEGVTNRVGFIPRTLNLGVFDYDGDDPEELEQFIKDLKPDCVIKTSGGPFRRHLFCHLTPKELQKHKESIKDPNLNWDWICDKNYVLIHDEDVGKLIAVLEKTKGMPREEEVDRDIGKVIGKPRKKKKAGKKAKKLVARPLNLENPLGESLSEGTRLSSKDSVSQKVEHIFAEQGFILPYHVHERKIRIKAIKDKDDYTIMGDRLDRKKSMAIRDIAHKHFIERVEVAPGEFEDRPMARIPTVEWDNALEAISDRNRVDYFLEWLPFNAKNYPQVDEKTALMLIEGRLYDVFDIPDVREDYVRHCSLLPFFTAVLRRFHPGIPVAQHLAIFGDSRSGKSTFARHIIPQGFSSLVLPKLDLLKDSKDLVYDVSGKVIAELNEMGNTRRADVNTVKGLLAEGKLTSRRVWEKTDSETLLTHATIGTGNLEEKPLPDEAVAAARFMALQIKRRPFQGKGKDGIGYIESILLKDQCRTLAYVVHLCLKWGLISECPKANEKLRGRAQAFIQDPPHELRDYHSEYVARFQYKPGERTNTIGERVTEWLFGSSNKAIDHVAQRHPKTGMLYLTGKQVEDGVPEYKKAGRGREKALESLGFVYEKISLGKDEKGKRIRLLAWTLSTEAERKLEDVFTATSKEPTSKITVKREEPPVLHYGTIYHPACQDGSPSGSTQGIPK